MTIDEACEFLRMKKSTMYYNLEHGNIPGIRRGKKYILFKDELIHWLEGGRTNSDAAMSAEEFNASIMDSQKRKPKIFSLTFHARFSLAGNGWHERLFQL